ncbi:hypothetical protein VKT23_010668 [Stygiomarasmius scandens]|uniref:Aminoglycoside phosphotransferase domain-containing protein n=1 Tax=Marasmiellus scandens TaxID=2682957 RepID=A0ABR1JB08_9AGAR
MIFGKHQYRLSIPWSEWLRFFCMKAATSLLDAFIFLQSLIAPAKRLTDQPLPIDEDTMDELFLSESNWEPDSEEFRQIRIVKKCLAVKFLPIESCEESCGPDALHCAEIRAMELVRGHTSIPVPRIRRVLPYEFQDPRWPGITNCWLVMDYVPGQLLWDAWPRLGMWKKLWVVVTLRRYVKELRKISQPYNGCVGKVPAHGKPLRCNLPEVLELRGRSLPSYDALKEYYNVHRRPRAREGHPPYGDSHSLVFTHGDIHKLNIILGDDGQLWLVDWGYSGFYPRWFEYQRMFIMGSEKIYGDRLIQPQDHIWQLLAGVICDYDPWTLEWFRRCLTNF